MSDSTPAPDGATTPPASDDAGGEPIRNIDDLKKLAAERDRYKSQVRKLQEVFSDGGQKPPDGQNIAEMMQTFMANQKAMETQLADATRQAADATAQNQQLKMDARQRILSDTVMTGVSDQNREAIKLMIPGILAEKKIDLSNTEDVKAAGDKCRKTLADRFPGMFGEPGSQSGGGSPSAPRKSYENVSWADLSPEEKLNMSEADFAKHFAGGGDQPERGRGVLLRKREIANGSGK